jgi:hypothetical protein
MRPETQNTKTVPNAENALQGLRKMDNYLYKFAVAAPQSRGNSFPKPSSLLFSTKSTSLIRAPGRPVEQFWNQTQRDLLRVNQRGSGFFVPPLVSPFSPTAGSASSFGVPFRDQTLFAVEHQPWFLRCCSVARRLCLAWPPCKILPRFVHCDGLAHANKATWVHLWSSCWHWWRIATQLTCSNVITFCSEVSVLVVIHSI